MTDRPETVVERLAIVVKSLTDANNALRRVVEEGASDLDQLEKYEHEFLDISEEIDHKFRERANKHAEEGEQIKSRLSREIELKRQQAESLKRHIDYLGREIDEQSSLNERLKQETEVSCRKLHALQKNDDQSSRLKPKSPQIFIKRLQNELD